MSLKAAALALAVLLVARTAAADDTSIALVGGYAGEIRLAERAGSTSYGWGIGTRLEHRLDAGLYIGGGFVGHLGSRETAEDSTGVSTYRVVRHAAYAGPEVGWEWQTRFLFVRPYVGGGAWFVLGRTAVRDREIADNGLSPYVMPGLALGYRAAHWHAGLDVRVPLATALPAADGAPTLFLTVGFLLAGKVRSLQEEPPWPRNPS